MRCHRRIGSKIMADVAHNSRPEGQRVKPYTLFRVAVQGRVTGQKRKLHLEVLAVDRAEAWEKARRTCFYLEGMSSPRLIGATTIRIYPVHDVDWTGHQFVPPPFNEFEHYEYDEEIEGGYSANGINQTTGQVLRN